LDKQLLIFGAAESARLARYYFEQDAGRKVAAFVVDDEFLREDMAGGLPVVAFSEVTTRFPPRDYAMHVAVAYGGANSIRQRKFEACRAAGYELPSYVSTKAAVWPDLVHGENCLILEQASIQPTVRLGSNVLVGTGVRLAHAALVHDHASFTSANCIGGNCEIGERAFLGMGAIVRDHCKIGDDAIVAMGATVSRNLPAGGVILAPASVMADPGAAELIRESSFPDPGA
jgi:sugar O-acyltransferase (sialic acid O-acetyltransferase NeuD family)